MKRSWLIPQARFDRAQFRSFAAESLGFELVYYVLPADYNQYMDVQQGINLHVFQRFLADEINFAHLTRVETHRQKSAGDLAQHATEA